MTSALDWRTCPSCEKPNALRVEQTPTARQYRCIFCKHIVTEARPAPKVPA